MEQDIERQGGKVSVSIICPVHNEERCIPLFFARLNAVLDQLQANYDFELIFTNNGSTDGSLAKIAAIRRDHPWVQVITLSRNFGYQASLMSGLANAKGSYFIIIDVDGEDPPELIPEFLECAKRGYDLVYGQRVARQEPAILQWARRVFYRVTRQIADNDFILDMAEFALFSYKIRDTILQNVSSLPFVRAEIAYAGFSRYGVKYTRGRRMEGETHYNLRSMANFAIAGVLTSSTFPLRLAAYAGIPVIAADVFVGAISLVREMDHVVNALILFNLAVIAYTLGSLSVYCARIYKDALNRPLYIVDREKTALNERPPVEHWRTRYKSSSGD